MHRPQSTARRPAGHMFVTDLNGSLTESDTLQCVHCGLHWQVVPGSKRKRGFCMACMGVTCGPACSRECYPLEKRLEDVEKSNSAIIVV